MTKAMTLKEIRRTLATTLARHDRAYDRDGFKRAVEEYLSEHEWLGRAYDQRARRPMLGWRRFVEECWKDYRDWRRFYEAFPPKAGADR